MHPSGLASLLERAHTGTQLCPRPCPIPHRCKMRTALDVNLGRCFLANKVCVSINHLFPVAYAIKKTSRRPHYAMGYFHHRHEARNAFDILTIRPATPLSGREYKSAMMRTGYESGKRRPPLRALVQQPNLHRTDHGLCPSVCVVPSRVSSTAGWYRHDAYRTFVAPAARSGRPHFIEPTSRCAFSALVERNNGPVLSSRAYTERPVPSASITRA